MRYRRLGLGLLAVLAMALRTSAQCSPPTVVTTFDISIAATVPAGISLCAIHVEGTLSSTTDCDGTATHFGFATGQPTNWLIAENCEALQQGEYQLTAAFDPSSPAYLATGAVGSITLTHRGCQPCACAPILTVTSLEFVSALGDGAMAVVLPYTLTPTICTTVGTCD